MAISRANLKLTGKFLNGAVSVGPITMEQLDDHRYRILEHPLLDEVAFGDIIEAERVDERAIRFIRVVERGAWQTFDFCITRDMIDSESLQQFLDRCEASGVVWERIFGGLLFIHVPPHMDYDPTDDVKRLLV